MIKLRQLGAFAKHARFCFKQARMQSWPALTLALISLLMLRVGLLSRACCIHRLKFRRFSLDVNIASGELCSLWENCLDRQYGPDVVPRPGLVVVDVGANIGVFSLQQLWHQPFDVTLIAIEPDPEVFQRLERNVSRNSNDRNHVVLLNVALGAEVGSVQFVRDRSTNSHVIRTGEAGADTITVQVDTLDRLVERYAFPRIDLLKIDVEGFELQVLHGGLRSALPITQNVVLEYHAGEGQDLVDLLTQSGFRVGWRNAAKCTLGFAKTEAELVNGSRSIGRSNSVA